MATKIIGGLLFIAGAIGICFGLTTTKDIATTTFDSLGLVALLIAGVGCVMVGASLIITTTDDPNKGDK